VRERNARLNDAFLGSRVLVTGGAGFIGSTLAIRLAEIGASVTVVDSLIPEYGGNLQNLAGYEDRIRINISDVRDDHGFQHLIREKDFLFNLAGQTSHVDSMQDPFTDLEINCRSQLAILEACRKHNRDVRIVFASTRQIYGKPRRLPVDEDHLVQPVDVNGINKAAGEWYHVLYNNVYGIRACSLRLTNTYGPRMRVKDARQTFLGIWIRRILSGEPFQVFGDGLQVRDFNYVEDVVDAMLEGAIRPEGFGRVFNLGSPERITLKELADLLVDCNGGGSYEVVPFPGERKVIDIGDYYADFARFQRSHDWQPVIGLREGLTKTLEYYRATGDKYF
jgi:UDP-glucose 4-epimerase